MHKKELIETLISRLSKKKTKFLESRNNYRKTSNEALSAMQSHSDTTKFQTGKLAENIENQLEKIESIIFALSQLGDKKSDSVQIGSLVELKENDKHSSLLIVPDGAGGEIIKNNDGTIQIVAIESPLGKTLALKKMGDCVEFEAPSGIRKIQILDIE